MGSLILVFPWTLLLGLQEGAKSKVPDGATRREAEKMIRDVFNDEYAKKDRADRLALARKLLAQEAETKDDPAARFVLFSQASELSAQAGDVVMAFRAIGELTATFDFDPLKLKEIA